MGSVRGTTSRSHSIDGSRSPSQSRSRSIRSGRSTPKPFTPPPSPRPVTRTRPLLANAAVRAISDIRAGLAKAFLREVDDAVCGGAVHRATAHGGGVPIFWSDRMRRVAGCVSWKRRDAVLPRFASSTLAAPVIERLRRYQPTVRLSTRLLTTETRVRDVIAHEFCHLAADIISGTHKNPHGAVFKRWGARCDAAFGHLGVKVTTYHSYPVDRQYIWACAGNLAPAIGGEHLGLNAILATNGCGKRFARIFKSVRTARSRCRACGGALVLVGAPKPHKKVESVMCGTPGHGAEWEI